MTFLNVNFETQETILKSIKQIEEKIANDIVLKVNKACYRLVDFEFYIFSKLFPDPHTYKNNLQLQSGKIYIHASGLDITFGDGENHGGILIRSVIKHYEDSDESGGHTQQQYEGPLVVATELLSNLNSLFSSEKNDISIVDTTENNQTISLPPVQTTIRTKRVGLTPKSDDPEDYYRNLPLRCLVVLQKSSTFKQKLKGIEGLLEVQVANGMKIEEAHDILGYKKKFT